MHWFIGCEFLISIYSVSVNTHTLSTRVSDPDQYSRNCGWVRIRILNRDPDPVYEKALIMKENFVKKNLESSVFPFFMNEDNTKLYNTSLRYQLLKFKN